MNARLTPYEIAFDVARFETDLFPAIVAEADERGTALVAPESLFMLSSTGHLLREMQPGPAAPSEADAPELPPAESVRQYGALLFHGLRFWSTGQRLLMLTEPLVRSLVGGAPIREWNLVAPAAAGYVQLPRHLIWARVDEDAAAEAMDGFFWSYAAGSAAGTGRLDLLLALGLHPGRPGFSVIEVAAALPAPAPGHWADLRTRDTQADFTNILPGGELRGLLSVTSAAEVLKLVSRVFCYIERWPAAVTAGDAPPGSAAGHAAHELPPSALQASVVDLME